MKTWLFAATASSVLMVVACAPPHPHHDAKAAMRQISALDCPEEEGDLKLKSGSASPRSCVYATEAGDEVTLQLVDLNGADPRASMSSMETALQAEVPFAVSDAKPPTPPAPGSANASAWSASDDKDQVNIDLPGIHIHGRGDGQADVDTAGVHVHAHDRDHGDGSADVVVKGGNGGVTVNAHDGGAQIRVDEPGPGVRLDYVLQSDKPGPHGYRLAGYEVRGPAGGPVVVAKILGKSNDDDDLRHDVRSLLKQNVGI
jgi:hypothetical protein